MHACMSLSAVRSCPALLTCCAARTQLSSSAVGLDLYPASQRAWSAQGGHVPRCSGYPEFHILCFVHPCARSVRGSSRFCDTANLCKQGCHARGDVGQVPQCRCHTPGKVSCCKGRGQVRRAWQPSSVKQVNARGYAPLARASKIIGMTSHV